MVRDNGQTHNRSQIVVWWWYHAGENGTVADVNNWNFSVSNDLQKKSDRIYLFPKKSSQKNTTVTVLHFSLFLFLFLSSYPEWHLQDHGRLSVVHRSKHSRQKETCTYVLDSSVRPHCNKRPAAPPYLMHPQEAAGCLIDVHDAVCADSVLVHQPAQLEEEPVRFGV